MTLEDLGNIGEFVGALGVVISLAYLAIQIRQNTRQITENTNALKLSEESAAQRNFSGLRLLLIGDPEASKIFERGLAADRSLDATDLFRFGQMLQQTLYSVQVLFRQVNRGFLPRERWSASNNQLERLAAAPGFLDWWQDTKGCLRPGLR